jgi:hypothetical protein
MLVKDPAKRIDWVDLFEYKILENGELLEPKHLSISPQTKSIRAISSTPTQLFNPTLSLGANMTPSSLRPQQPVVSIKQDTSFNNESHYKNTVGSYPKMDAKNPPAIRRKSPLHNDLSQPDRRYVPSYSGTTADTNSNKLSCSSVSPLK